ncbi:hypothetical protein ALC62_15723 [Cyphomyrmex costatus]|uniref:Uncharacterized protein n=1 Tax=Cyphomyrmex costatus TaxID=456900 RepID=A0A151I6M7_9HYME|nr:hypothetical protein ALC62_15723 [Cyphomyrmex costatus]
MLNEESPLPPFEDRKNIVEIKFAALIAEKNLAFETAQSILSFFQDLGEDPKVLKSMTMNRNKAPKIISNVLCVREQKQLVDKLQNTKFSIFVDKTSDVTNDKWMTFLVWYVDPKTLNVRTELLELIHLDASDCSAEKLFITFRNKMWKKQIPFENIVALSCDNASVMTGKHESFQTKLQQYCKNLITMPCPCHASALVANAACNAIPHTCEELLRKVASFISNSPKRVCIFSQFQKSFSFDGTCRKILKLSETRWLSRHACVARLNENWDVLLKYLQKEQFSEKSKSGAALLSMMQNPEIHAYLLFLEYILDAFNKFNAFFQTEEIKVHLLQSAAENLLKTVLKNVIKAPLLNFVSEGTINPLLACNRLFPDRVMVREACQDLDQLNQDHGEIVQSVYDNCLTFHNIAAKEIRDRLFIKDEFMSKLRIFEPKFTLQQEDEKNSPNNSVQDVLFVAQRFDGFDEEMLKEKWQSLNLDFASQQKTKIINLSFDEAWKTIMATKKVDGKYKYSVLRLKKFLNIHTTLLLQNIEQLQNKTRIIICTIDIHCLITLKCCAGCPTVFKTSNGFRKDIKKYYELQNTPLSNAPTHDINNDFAFVPDHDNNHAEINEDVDNFMYENNEDIKQNIFHYVTNLYLLKFPDLTITKILAAMSELIFPLLDNIVSIPDLNKREDLANKFKYSFENYLTKYGRNKFFKGDMNEPIQVSHGIRFDKKYDNETQRYKQIPITNTFTYIPLLKTLQFLWPSIGKFRFHIYIPGIFFDEFEVCNLLGSKTDIHKIEAFYFVINNFPMHINSTLENILLLALYYTANIKQFGLHPVLQKIINNIKILKTEGIFIESLNISIKGTLVSLVFDNLGGAMLLGMNEKNFNSFANQLDYANNDTINFYGIRSKSSLFNLTYFSPSINCNVDIMHDFLEGICQRDLDLHKRANLPSVICLNKLKTFNKWKLLMKEFNISLTLTDHIITHYIIKKIKKICFFLFIKNMCVCSLHFKQEDYITSTGKVIIFCFLFFLRFYKLFL